MSSPRLSGPKPPYVQLAEDLASAIAAGQYAPGDQLPPLKTLAAEYGVAIGTVKSALALLRDQAMVTTRHGIGSFVHPEFDPAGAGPVGGLGEVLRLLNEIRDRLAVIEDRLPPVASSGDGRR